MNFLLLTNILTVVLCSGYCYTGNLIKPAPFETTQSKTMVNISLSLSIESFDPVVGILRTSGLLGMSWIDLEMWEVVEKVFPNKTSLGYSRVFLDPALVWKPVLVLLSSRSKFLQPGSEAPMQINKNNGFVGWNMFSTWDWTCVAETMKKFPFDQHVCQLQFSLWEVGFVDFQHGNWSFSDAIPQIKHSILYLRFEKVRIETVNYSCEMMDDDLPCQGTVITFPIYLERKFYPFYFFSLYIPMLCLWCLQAVAFMIPFNCPERLSFSVNLFVAQTVSRTEFQNNIPTTSEIIPTIVASNCLLLSSMISTVYFCVIYYIAAITVDNNTTEGKKQSCKKRLRQLTMIDRVMFGLFTFISCLIVILSGAAMQ